MYFMTTTVFTIWLYYFYYILVLPRYGPIGPVKADAALMLENW